MKLSDLEGMLTDRTVILGVGNDIKGDDGVGSYIARRLERQFRSIDGKSVPEAYAYEVISHKPDIVLIIDAAKMGSRPGSVGVFTKEDVKNISSSTHSMPLSMLSKHLEKEAGCMVYIIGIEPMETEFDMKLTDTVRKSADNMVEILKSYKSSKK